MNDASISIDASPEPPGGVDPGAVGASDVIHRTEMTLVTSGTMLRRLRSMPM
jgi:hypothetical protein